MISEITIPMRTAADLMTRDVRTIRDSTPLTQATRILRHFGHRGLPVVDEFGRCVGVLSVTDIARWTANRDEGQPELPRTCSFQGRHQDSKGREVELCLLEEGACPFRQVTNLASPESLAVCTQPHCVPTEWQIVEMNPSPWFVRDVMTTAVVSVEPETPMDEMARLMLEKGVHRLMVLDLETRPVGIVTVNDLLRSLAYPPVGMANAD